MVDPPRESPLWSSSELPQKWWGTGTDARGRGGIAEITRTVVRAATTTEMAMVPPQHQGGMAVGAGGQAVDRRDDEEREAGEVDAAHQR